MRGWRDLTVTDLAKMGRGIVGTVNTVVTTDIPASDEEPKYGNEKVFSHGRHFDSKKEAQRYFELLLMHRAGLISEPRCQIPFNIYACNGERVAKYVADFEYVDLKTGETRREDVKGGEATKTRLYRLKIKLLRAQGIVITEV